MSHSHLPYQSLQVADDDVRDRSLGFYDLMSKRRSIRFFSDKTVPREVIETIIMTASTAPSGAHKQPWSFVAVSSGEVKEKIRKAAEEEEYRNYNGRMSEEWLDDLAKFDTDWHKPFITTAPWIIVLFRQPYGLDDQGQRVKHYYVNESVGIAAGMLITAIHNAGLVTLTHTPSPMNFLERLLNRPSNEKAFLLLPVGYPANEATVPVLTRKSIGEVATFHE